MFYYASVCVLDGTPLETLIESNGELPIWGPGSWGWGLIMRPTDVKWIKPNPFTAFVWTFGRNMRILVTA